ncbi:MAG: hypothetical protein KGP28_08010 [Bdellovibrionales bacterium]|nr:hypothetical protein [Bdellovibrionales bacterium]
MASSMNILSRFKAKLFQTPIAHETYWAQVYRSSIQGDSWLRDLSLNPGRWGASYSLLYILTRSLKALKPETILEFGLGEATEVFLSYQRNLMPKAKIFTIEHDQEWCNFRLPLLSNPTKGLDLVHLPLEKRLVQNYETVAYKGVTEKLLSAGLKFELILVDGPFGSDRFSRTNILDVIETGQLNDQFVIILDDSNRKGEKDTEHLISDLLKRKNYKFFRGYFQGEKGQTIFTSQRFLTSI